MDLSQTFHLGRNPDKECPSDMDASQGKQAIKLFIEPFRVVTHSRWEGSKKWKLCHRVTPGLPLAVRKHVNRKFYPFLFFPIDKCPQVRAGRSSLLAGRLDGHVSLSKTKHQKKIIGVGYHSVRIRRMTIDRIVQRTRTPTGGWGDCFQICLHWLFMSY